MRRLHGRAAEIIKELREVPKIRSDLTNFQYSPWCSVLRWPAAAS